MRINKPVEILGCGFPRTGGQSLAAALNLCGVGPIVFPSPQRVADLPAGARIVVEPANRSWVRGTVAHKYIYTHRDPDDWLASIRRTAPQNFSHPAAYWNWTDDQLLAERAFRERYLRERTYLPQLWLNICDDDGETNWRKLCEFLGVDRPPGPFPHRDLHAEA